MQIIEGSGEVPVVYSAHHASYDFGEFSNRVALTPDQRMRFSDFGTDQTVSLNGIATMVADRSRALGDLNRSPDDDGGFQEQDYAKPNKHDIWLPGQALTDAEKAACRQMYYHPYHNKILELLAAQDRPVFVVAWDNTANYQIGENEAGEGVTMPHFVLSNRAREGGASEPLHAQDDKEGAGVSSDPEFVTLLAQYFSDNLADRDLPDGVELNLVYKGGYICRRYSTLRNSDELTERGVRTDVQSVQLEYNTDITHHPETLEFYAERAIQLREAFSEAMQLAYDRYKRAM